MRLPFLLLLLACPFSSYAQAKKSPPMVSQVSRLRFEVSLKAMEKQIQDPMSQLATFTALPTMDLSGIKVSGFLKGCLLPKFGLRSGDVVEMVNGQPLATPADVMEIGERLAKAKPGHKVRVNIRRGSEDIVQNYLLVE